MINKITSDSSCKLFDARWKNCRVKSPYEQKFEKKKTLIPVKLLTPIIAVRIRCHRINALRELVTAKETINIQEHSPIRTNT